MIKKIALVLSGILTAYGIQAQTRNLDKIAGRVGNSIILNSELNVLYNQEKENNYYLENYSVCDALYEMMVRQILVAQAERDSVIVSDAEVEQKIQERINYFLSMAGSREELERKSGKTIYQMREENRLFFKEQLTAQEMQRKLVSAIKVTPFEVEQFYKTLNPDSLTPIPATVEVGQIIFQPKPSQEMEDYAKEKLEGIRKDIVEKGKSFATMASLYGMDRTKLDGGNLLLEKDKMDPTFVSAAMKLQPGEISPVFRSKFGYHIVQMVSKTSNTTAKVKHIVIIPEVTTTDFEKTKVLADSVARLLKDGKITFGEAVNKYTTDENAKMTGGMIMNMQTGTTNMQMDELDPYAATNIQKMQVGEYSEAHYYADPYTEQRSVRIIYLQSRVDPHLLNLKDDYALLQQKALSLKQARYLEKYIDQKIPNFYINVDEEYRNCGKLQPWLQYSKK